MKRWRRHLFRGLAGLLVLLNVVGIAGFFYARTSLPQTDGSIVIDGVSAPVSIERDRYGLVTIRAANDADALFALGYAHAQDRLFQMELTRRFGAGRLAETIGDALLETDKHLRFLGFYRQAEEQAAHMSAPLRATVDAYTAGVNSYLETHKGAWPAEFYLMRITPEPWRPADSLVWGQLMALQLSGNWQAEYLRARLAQVLTPTQLEWLWPADGSEDVASAATGAERRIALVAPAAAPFDTGPLGASNAWAVAPGRSASGEALLAGDPHLGLRLPSYWYLVRIVTPERTIAGATAPGVPLFIIGYNDDVAWTFTTTHGDTQDLFIERIDPDDPTRYLTPDGSEPFEVRRETILVGDDAVNFEFRATRHGPVLTDIGEALALIDNTTVVSLAWTCLESGDRTSEALYRINYAKDAAEITAALDQFVCPLQNIIYADRFGSIGMAVAGKVPVRAELSAGSQMPADGWTGAYDWIGYVTAPLLPSIVDPASGWVANANNRVTPPGYPHFIAARTEAPYRIERIDRVLADTPQATLDDMSALQADTLSLAAEALVPAMVEFLSPRIEDPLDRETLALLASWDLRVDRDEAAPLILHAFMKEAGRAVFADELGNLYDDFGWWNAPLLLRLMAGGSEAEAWCDDTRTEPVERCIDTLALAYGTAIDSIVDEWGGDPAAWRWGAAHPAEFYHPIWGSLLLVNRLLTPKVETPGDTYTVDRGTPDPDEDDASFPNVHAASLRFAIDLADPGGARFIIPGGQSGNIFSPHYDDLVPLWRDGSFLSIVGPAESVLTLTPPDHE